jgi:hypothetical protein
MYNHSIYTGLETSILHAMVHPYFPNAVVRYYSGKPSLSEVRTSLILKTYIVIETLPFLSVHAPIITIYDEDE